MTKATVPNMITIMKGEASTIASSADGVTELDSDSETYESFKPTAPKASLGQKVKDAMRKLCQTTGCAVNYVQSLMSREDPDIFQLEMGLSLRNPEFVNRKVEYFVDLGFLLLYSKTHDIGANLLIEPFRSSLRMSCDKILCVKKEWLVICAQMERNPDSYTMQEILAKEAVLALAIKEYIQIYTKPCLLLNAYWQMPRGISESELMGLNFVEELCDEALEAQEERLQCQ